jgi:MFS family permease
METVFMKRSALFFIIFRLLVSGIEEYMILPTAWIYIRSLGQDKGFVGLTLASYAGAVVLFTPFLNKLVNRYRCPKLILLFCHILRVCGNAIYSLSSSPYFPMIGRILCGISAASDVLLLGEIARTTEENHRGKVFILLDGIYTLGCALGPIFATILTLQFSIYSWNITPESSPGFVLAVVWLFVFLLSTFLPREFSQDEDLSETQLVLTPSGFADEYGEDPQKTAVNRSQILCLLCYIFFMWLFACVTIYSTPVMATELFKLRQLHINLLFGIALLFQLALYLICYVVRNRLNERVLLLAALFLQAVPLSIMGVFGIHWDENSIYLLLVYIICGTPLVAFTLSWSLLSKLIHPQLTAYYQHLAYTSLHVATVFGRILAAFFFAKSLLAWLALQLGLLWVMITLTYTVVFFMQY